MKAHLTLAHTNMHMCTHKEKGPLIIQNILCYALLHYTLLHTFCCCFIKYRQSSLSQSSYSEAVIRMYSVKNMFLEILQNSQENTGSLRPATLSKKRLWRRYFPVNFAKFLRTPFIIKHLWWLLLNYWICL